MVLAEQKITPRPLGNITAATCDIWSNESTQNIKLLGCIAPICYTEQPVRDCRLMDQAPADGHDAALLCHTLEEPIAGLPGQESGFIDQTMPMLDQSKFIAREYVP